MMVELEKHRHLQKVIPLPELKEGKRALASGSSEATRSARRGSRIVEAESRRREGGGGARSADSVGRYDW